MTKLILMIPVFLLVFLALTIAYVNPALLFPADHSGLFLGLLSLFLIVCSVIGRYFSD